MKYTRDSDFIPIQYRISTETPLEPIFFICFQPTHGTPLNPPGFGVGALKGSVEALRSKAPVPGLENSSRLTFNRVLNMSGEQGKKASMALACLGLLFSLAESGAGYVGDTYVPMDYPELMNSVVGGFFTGALYRAPRGPRAAALTGLVGAAAGAAARPMLDRNKL